MRSDSNRVVRAIRKANLRGAGWPALAALALVLAALLAAGARAQGVRYDNIVLGPRGTPVAGAEIAICTAAATRTATPCSPLAQIYSDQALTQPAANPFPADSLGNYGFWAEPGHYVVQIYGTGVTTRAMDVFLACDPTNCSMSSATFSTITAGTLNLSGSLTVNGRSVATVPAATDAVQYVSPTGSDSNDGLSWGTAKATIYAAWNALAAVDSGSNGGNGGTMYVAPNSTCGGPTTGQGLQIMGPADPNWNSGSPSVSGWVVQQTIRVIGVGGKYYGWVSSAPSPATTVICGSGSSANLPALWISGTNTPMEFDNLVFTGTGGNGYQSLRMGIDSNDTNEQGGGATSIVFRNDQFGASSNASGGPTIEIGSNVFEIYFHELTVAADNSATAGTAAHQAISIDAGSGTNCRIDGLLFFNNVHLETGGLYMNTEACGANSNSLSVDNLITENQNDGKGAVWLTGLPSDGIYNIQNIVVADAVPASPTIEVDSVGSGAQADQDVLTTNSISASPGQFSGIPGGTDVPSVYNQQGFAWGKVWGQSDAGRRLFGLTDSRWTNLALFLPSAWATLTTNHCCTTTETNVTDPSGTSYAGESSTQPFFYDSTQTLTAGDFIIIGAWDRVPGGHAYQPISMSFPSGGCLVQPLGGSSSSNYSFAVKGVNQGDGQWSWASEAFVVTAGGSCDLRFQGDNGSTTTDYYAPVMYVVPGSSVSSYSEIADEAVNLGTYAYGLGTSVDSTMPGHPIAFGGTGDDYFATLDHSALGSNQTYTLPATGGALGVVLGQTTVAGPTAAIASGACATTITTSVAGVATTTTILATPAADPAAANYKSLTVYWFPTAGAVNLEVCNPSSASVTPAALTFNVRAIE